MNDDAVVAALKQRDAEIADLRAKLAEAEAERRQADEAYTALMKAVEGKPVEGVLRFNAAVLEAQELRAKLAEAERQNKYFMSRLNAVAVAQDEHCKDCCCARSWAALGITEHTGMSIPEHIADLRAKLAEFEEHERQTHERLGAILGTDDSLEQCARRMRAWLVKAEQRNVELEGWKEAAEQRAQSAEMREEQTRAELRSGILHFDSAPHDSCDCRFCCLVRSAQGKRDAEQWAREAEADLHADEREKLIEGAEKALKFLRDTRHTWNGPIHRAAAILQELVSPKRGD